MATDLRRFTISVTPTIDRNLDKAKRKVYYKKTQNEMIRDLLTRGLQSLEKELKKEKQNEEYSNSD